MAHLTVALAETKSTTLEWLTTARNHARYANQGGQYDEILQFLDKHSARLSAAARYRIPDEPAALHSEAGLIVDPLWPLFAQMLVGTWMALPWFLANGLFMGSPTRRREWALIAGASLFGAAHSCSRCPSRHRLVRRLHSPASIRPTACSSITVLKLGCAYGLYMMQQRAFQLWRHFGGKPKNGMLLVIAAMVFVKPNVTIALGKSLLAIILG